jgi:hypothetical protein
LIPELGAAAVAGQTDRGKTWGERCRYSIDILGKTTGIAGPVLGPEEVQTLDECVLILPRSMPQNPKFDENLFEGWDCYSVDYCLSAGNWD